MNSNDKVIDTSEATFDAAVLGSELPVLVEFWAEWCGPCFRLAPILEEVAGDQAGRTVIARLNIEQNRALGLRHGVQRIPTLMLFIRGSVVATREGVPSRAQVNEFLASHVGPGMPSERRPS